MCDPLAYAPSPRQHASPSFDAFAYKQNDDSEVAKLRGVVKALNEVVNARKNEAEALQQQLDGVSQDYEILFREKEAADREVERLKEQVIQSSGVNVINAMSGTARGSSYNGSRQTISNPPSFANRDSPSPISHPSVPFISAPSSRTSIEQHEIPPHNQIPASRLKHLAVLFAVILFINITLGYYLLPSQNTNNQVPKHIALATQGSDLLSSVSYEDIVSDPLFNVTVEHINNNLGGSSLLLGELVELGIVLQPLKGWRAVATVCRGLNAEFPNAVRSVEEAEVIVRKTCWSCKDSVSIPSDVPSVIFNMLMAIEVIAIIALISKRLTAPPLGTSPSAAEEDSLRDKLPILMFHSDITKSIRTAFVNKKDDSEDYEITILLDDEKSFVHKLVDSILGVEKNRFLELEMKDKSISLISSAAGKQTWETVDPIAESEVIPRGNIKMLYNRPMLYSATRTCLLSATTSQPLTKFTEVRIPSVRIATPALAKSLSKTVFGF